MKGQIEMVSLILLVIIAGLVIAFALVFSANKGKEAPIHETFGESILADNFVTVLAKTYVPECRQEFSTLVKDCVRAGNDVGTKSCDDGRYSCDWMRNVSEEVLEDSLEAWGESYRFKIEKVTPDPVVLWEESYNGCTEDSEKESPGRQPVPLFPEPGEAYIVLEICKT